MVKFEDVKKASENINDLVERTRTRHSKTISDIAGADVYLKFENRQNTGSFKARGALNAIKNLSDESKKKGVIAMSAGNHAQGVAYMSEKMGIPSVIVMPENTPFVKVRNTQKYGAEVVLHGDFVQATAHAEKLAKENGYTFIHPYDNADVIAGQGTVGLEMMEDVSDLDVVLTPIGGGGLASGVALAVKGINPKVKVYGVQTEMYPAVKQILNNEKVAVGGSTIAEGVAVKHPGKMTVEIIKSELDDILTVTEEQIERAMVLILENDKTLVEGAGAVALAGVLANQKLFKGKKVGVILSGGNIDQRILASVLMRDLVHIGRLGRLRIYLPDQPGVLSNVSAIIGDGGGNIVEMTYQHIFSHATVKETSIEIAIETKGKTDFSNIVETLNEKGFKTVEMSAG
ncbi:MAG: threonine ammonia-lyase [Alphaproteobacteria bacterium]